jgi:hypothetical protein
VLDLPIAAGSQIADLSIVLISSACHHDDMSCPYDIIIDDGGMACGMRRC